jgi:hypothetical protein
VRGQVVYFGAAGTAPLGAVASLRTGSPGATLHTALTDEEGSTAPGNPAEWLVDLFTRAEREGCVDEFVQQYAGSALKQVLVRCLHTFCSPNTTMLCSQLTCDWRKSCTIVVPKCITKIIYLLCICLQSNVAETAQLAKQRRSLPAHVQAELAVRRETVTPWWWGLRTLIKVCAHQSCAGLHQTFQVILH